MIFPQLSISRRRPPPLWYVSNGETTVGPVRTDLLARGIWHERIPDDCMVRESRWQSFRRLDQIREIRAVWRGRAHGASCAREALTDVHRRSMSFAFEHAQDASEILLLALGSIARVTGAQVALGHRARRTSGPPVASYAQGPGMSALLGLELDPSDPVVAAARSGRALTGSPSDGFAHRRVALRLGASALLSGVAMVPVVSRSQLLAVIELGRTDHAFRAEDVAAATALARGAAEALFR